jgi:ABC-type sulfate/molybdate transport systems ATPase subunit
MTVKRLDLDQRVRLGIACAVLQRPRLLLLDAPAAGLSGHDRDRFLADLPKLVALPEAMVVLVAGSADEALALGGEALILDQGHAAETGPVEQAFDRPRTLAAARAAAAPHLNVLVIGEGGRLADGSRFHPPPELRLPAGACTLTFRAGDAAFERRGPDSLRFAARVAPDPAVERFVRVSFADATWLVPAPSAPLAAGIVASVFVPVGKLRVFDADGRAV